MSNLGAACRAATPAVRLGVGHVGRLPGVSTQDAPRYDVEGRVALVTGAARGLGRSIARTLAKAGADVALGLRDAGADAGLVAEIEATGRRVLPLQMNVTDTAQVSAAVA